MLLEQQTDDTEVGASADGLLYVNCAEGSRRHLLYYQSRKTHRWQPVGGSQVANTKATTSTTRHDLVGIFLAP